MARAPSLAAFDVDLALAVACVAQPPPAAAFDFPPAHQRKLTTSFLFRYNPAQMNGTYEITPEMLNLSWRQSFLSQFKHAAVYLVIALIVAAKSNGIWTVIGEAAWIALIGAILMRPLSRVRLHITDDTIEDLDGPSISRDTIFSVAETTEGCPGLEVIGRREPSWLPKYHIFIPAALPQYEEIKQTLQAWQFTQQHR